MRAINSIAKQRRSHRVLSRAGWVGVGGLAGTFQYAVHTLINEREGYANLNTTKVALTQRTQKWR